MDFLASYGLAITVMLLAFVSIYEIALSPNNPAVFCTPSPGFNCNFMSVNSVGIMTAKFSQALGTQITINGVACSSQQSGGADMPKYGNINVANTITYYDTQQSYPPGNVIYSGSYYIFYVNCYNNAGGGLATGKVGQPFTGYLWLNYTVPNYGQQTQKIATFSTLYS